MTFGEKLQRLRARKGLSQDALAELLDVSRQAEDIVVTQEEQSAGLVWFVLYGVVLAAGVLLCRRRKERDP